MCGLSDDTDIQAKTDSFVRWSNSVLFQFSFLGPVHLYNPDVSALLSESLWGFGLNILVNICFCLYSPPAWAGTYVLYS